MAEKKTKKNFSSIANSIYIFILCLLTVAGGISFWIYNNLTTPFAHKAQDEIITIEPGLGTRGIISCLSTNGIISSDLPLLIYVTLKPNYRILQAGDYQFESPITPLQAIEKIHRGEITTRQVTIPEGLDIYEIAEILKSRESTESNDSERILLLLNQTKLISDIAPFASSLEGYLFPDTYSYSMNTTNTELIEQMVKRFKEVFTSEMKNQAHKLELSVHQVVTLASLIEKEARVDEDRALISSVFHNRLNKKMRLECDPTFIYAAMLQKTWNGNVNDPHHRQLKSPYNTYQTAGLPPGPIAVPGKKSLLAALYPAKTNYLYFVLGEGGKHRFSNTKSEHDQAVIAYRQLQKNIKIND